MFRMIGESPFPQTTTLRCEVWEWAPWRTTRWTGRLSTRFLCPIDENAPRRFFFEPAVNALFSREPSHRFLDGVLRFGQTLLAELENHDEQTQDVYNFYLKIFPHRNARPFGINREFGTVQDLMTRSDAGMGWESVVPGFSPDQEQIPLRDAKQAYTASRINLGLSPLSTERGPLAGILEAFRVAKSTEPPTGTVPSELISVPNFGPGWSAFDRLMMEGLEGRHTLPNLRRIVDTARSALIYLPDEVAESSPLPDPLAARLFTAIREAERTKRRADFTSWLNNSKAHGFLQQLGAEQRSLNSIERRALQNQARRSYGDLLWSTYQIASRCYGAWAMLVYIEFGACEAIAADETERWLFRHMHYRHACLAGLPLCFLNRSQTRWIWEDLRSLWASRCPEPDAYDVVVDRLGLFGAAVRNRRNADVNLSRSGATAIHTDQEIQCEEVVPAKERDVETEIEVPVITSPECPTCGGRLNLLTRFEQLPGGMRQAQFKCPRCETEQLFRIDPASLNPDQE